MFIGNKKKEEKYWFFQSMFLSMRFFFFLWGVTYSGLSLRNVGGGAMRRVQTDELSQHIDEVHHAGEREQATGSGTQ